MFWFVNMILGGILMLIGHLMDKKERADDERRWRELDRRDETRRTR